MDTNDTLRAEGPSVMTFRQFAARGGYDCDISHDFLRFPHGISKIQHQRNRAAASHHLREACRAMKDYADAIANGTVRAPTATEDSLARLSAHPDHDSTRATWRVRVRRLQRRDPSLSAEQAIARIIEESMDGQDPWAEALGLTADAPLDQVSAARCRWMSPLASDASA